MDNENKAKKSNLKLILMIIIPIILIISMILGFMVVAEKNISDIIKVFEKEAEENSILLEEFLVNIKSPAGKGRYLKIKLALMYTEKRHGEILIVNVNKIRDIIIADLRVKETEDILETEGMAGIKSQIMEDINESLGGDIVKDIYITDLIVQ